VSDYDFSYGDDGVYGAVIKLVAENSHGTGVHLDVGCGFGAIAEPVRDRGTTYVGVDLEPAGLADLAGRGFETGRVDLRDVAGAIAEIERIVAGRSLACITLLDTLEHLADGRELLAALQRLAASESTPLVVSVPNVTHQDLGIKLLTGRWDYTDTGLLDRTHLVHHTESGLAAVMRANGWREVGRADFELVRSDQDFPRGHVGLAHASQLNDYLTRLRRAAGPHATTNQFVRAYLPEDGGETGEAESAEIDEPFLTVVLRTRADRPAQLRDALLCLLAQDDQDFDVVLALHDAAPAGADQVLAAVRELPASLSGRVRLLQVTGGGRARPLNEAFGVSRGEYVAVLDDDDLVLGHWVAGFRPAAAEQPGRVLRSVCVAQRAERVTVADVRAVRSAGPVEHVYPSSYDLGAHLVYNRTPFMAMAFPRSLYRDMGLRFDESLDVCEDWDFGLRAALLVGVASSSEVTSIYRRWSAGASEALHSSDEWRAAEGRILARLDDQVNLFPPGTVGRLRQVEEMRGYIWDLEQAVHQYATSRSWRLTRPMRALLNGLRRRSDG
jgi:SAM-dependent methyltransferase